MAYNQQQQQGGYGQYNAYGQGGNPYTQQQQSNPYEQPYGHSGNYSERPDLEHQSSSRYDEESARGSGYEMTNMNNGDPNRILNEVRLVNGSIDTLESSLQRLRELQIKYLDEPNAREDSALARAVNASTDELMSTYASLTNRVKRVKMDPESQKSRNQAQVNKLDRRLKAAINQYQQLERDYEQLCKDQIVRQYLVARPDASEAEIQDAVENNNRQIFSSTLMAGNRRGEAQSALNNNETRHKALEKIERQMVELAQMFNELETMIVQQEPAVTQIEEKGEQATRHVAQANTELDGAVKKAKSARRKKFICLGIALLIVIIIVVVVVVVVEVTKH